MAKPRIFISSTFYDLRQVRADLELFLDQIGYEAVRNEEGDIPYGKEEALEEYCYNEIKSVDILVSIVGGRYGSESRRQPLSISQMELRTALKESKQVYIFIDKNVLSEYETYLLNKDSSNLKFKYVDNVKIYEFIEEIKGLGANNNIKGFETSVEITKYLKEQFAGLFQRFLEDQARVKEISLIKNLEKTAQTLNKLVNFLSEENKDQTEEINRILTVNHLLVENLKIRLEIPYNFYIEGLSDMTELFKARGFSYHNDNPFEAETADFYLYSKKTKNKRIKIKVSHELFDSEGKLKFIKRTDWKDSFLQYDEEDIQEPIEEDLPF